MNINKEERQKFLNLDYFDEYITSDEENDFEEKELIEEGEVVDPMAIENMEESEEERDPADEKQEEQQPQEVQAVDEALEAYISMPHDQRCLLTCDELFALYLRHTC